MDFPKYKAIAKQMSADLDALAKKYDLSNYGFIGFVGEPGKGHVPVCIHAVTKPKYNDHLHIKLSKGVFLQAAKTLGEIGGNITEVIIE
jgi:hypothetical protein